jgi:hypothetical protein
MVSNLHQSVVDMIHQVTDLMDRLMRDAIDLGAYTEGLKSLDPDGLLDAYQKDLMQNPDLVHYLNALMMISSLQQELDFQVAEYGVNVASEDIKMLKDLLPKLSDTQ